MFTYGKNLLFDNNEGVVQSHHSCAWVVLEQPWEIKVTVLALQPITFMEKIVADIMSSTLVV